MPDLDPQVQIKLIEISKAWAEKAGTNIIYDSVPEFYPREFDNIYKKLLKTLSGK